MANEKLMRANFTVLAAYPEAFADPANPTAAELNDQFTYDPADKFKKVFNISCALVDDSSIPTVTDSETNDERTICTIGNVENPTFTTYEVSMDAFRDKNVDDQGVFNLFFNLFNSLDRPYYIITRVSKPSDAPFLTDGSDDIKMFGVNTDNPIDLIDDGSMLKFGARFKNTGNVLINYRVES